MKNKLCLILAILSLTASCASYRAQSLPLLTHQSAAFSEKIDNIEVSCKAFTKKDCEQYLDRDVITKGYQPVHISVENSTNRYLIFSKSNIDITCADPAYVAKEVHTSTVGRATSYGVGALFVWPLAIPAIVDGVKSSNANEKLDKDFASKTSTDQIITPYGHLNGLLFIPIELVRDSFNVTLVDKETKEKFTFSLNLVRT